MGRVSDEIVVAFVDVVSVVEDIADNVVDEDGDDVGFGGSTHCQ